MDVETAIHCIRQGGDGVEVVIRGDPDDDSFAEFSYFPIASIEIADGKVYINPKKVLMEKGG